MCSLPQYHLILTDDNIMNMNMNEKAPIYKDDVEVDFDPRIHHPASVGLFVDNADRDLNADPASRGNLGNLKARYRGLSGIKKAFVAMAVVWFTMVILHKATKSFSHHHRHHGHHGHRGEDWRMHSELSIHENGHEGTGRFLFGGDCGKDKIGAEQFEIVPTVYGTSMDQGDHHSANATFNIPLGIENRRALSFRFEGINGEVIISRSEVTYNDEQAESEANVEVIVESSYVGESDIKGDGALMQRGDDSDQLILSSNARVDSHRVHLVLPQKLLRVPSLTIGSTKSLNLVIDHSASEIIYDRLVLRSDLGDVSLPSALQGHEVEIETISGSVSGTYNVSRALVIKTLTGNIDAKVHVLPPWQGPSKRPPPPHKPKHGEEGRPPHPPHGDDDDEEPHHDPSRGKHDHNLDDEDGHPHRPEKKSKHEKKHGKHEKKHKKHEKKDKHHRKHDHGHKHKEHHETSWFSLPAFIFGKKHHDAPPPPSPPHGPPDSPSPPPPPPSPPHGPHEPPHGPPHGPPPPGPHGPPPVFIGAFSTTGRVNLTVLSQDVWTSSEIKAFTKVSNVTVVHSETFRGTYELGTFKGNYTVTIPKKEDYKDHKIVDQGVTETGGWQVGIVGYKRPEGEKPPQVPDTPNKGPGDPPRPAPGTPPPGSPGGPEHRPPPPKGHSRVFAHTDIGNVDLTL